MCASDSDSIRAEERTWERDEDAAERRTERTRNVGYRCERILVEQRDDEREVGIRTKKEDCKCVGVGAHSCTLIDEADGGKETDRSVVAIKKKR